MRSPGRWTLAAVAWYGTICVLSQIPGKAIQEMPFTFWDKGAHFGVYAVLGFFIYGAAVLRGVRWSRALAFTIFAAVVLGGLDEIHQLFVPGRFAGLDDVAADVLGGSFGGLIGVVFIRK